MAVENPDPAAGGTPAPDAAAAAAAAAAATNSPSQPDAAAAAASEKPAGETPAAEKPAGEKPAGETSPPAPAGAPEKYSLALPAGTTALDATDVAQIEALARQNNLPNDKAQELLTAHAARVGAQHKAWGDETAADAEVGGANLEATRQQTSRLVEEFMPAGDPDRAALDAMLGKEGLGNRRPLVKLLARIARGRAEDPTLGRQRTGGQGERSAADVLFGDIGKQR